MSVDKTYKNIKTKTGRQLYGLLPEIYRSRDSAGSEGRGDLAKFLDACGELLDLLRNTLDQRLADSFPDNPEKGRECQAWLLPYFAQLLDVRLVSPDKEGRRDEVAKAVAWRQRKGTRTAVEQIAEAVAQTEVKVQEGWKRVATTPRIGMPLLPAKALGEAEAFDDHREHPAWAARHPGLPSTMVDLRYPSRAIKLDIAADGFPQNPAAKLLVAPGQSPRSPLFSGQLRGYCTTQCGFANTELEAGTFSSQAGAAFCAASYQVLRVGTGSFSGRIGVRGRQRTYP
jgi:hypothetical protein